jgi:glycosyl transferase family 87
MTDSRRYPGRLALRVVTGVLVCVHIVLVLQVVRQQPRAGARRHSLAARFFHDVAFTRGPGADFFALYHAGVSARRGLSVFEAGENPAVTPYYYPYRYLPFTAATIGKLAAILPPATAWKAWLLAIELVLLALVVAIRGACSRVTLRLAATAILLLSAPYWLELYLGQFTFVATALTCLAVLRLGALVDTTVPTLLLTTGGLLKVFPLVVLPALLRSRPARVAAVVTVAVVAGVNLPLFFSESGSVDAFWSKNFIGEPVGLDAGNHGLLYVAYLLGEMVWGAWHLPTWGAVTILWRVATLGATTAIVLRARAARVETASALLLIAHFVSYFQVWEHHMSGAIVAGMLLCIGLERSGATHMIPMALVGTAALALPTPFALFGPDPSGWSLLQRLAPPLSKAIPLVLLYGVGVAAMRSVPRGKSATSTVRHGTA